MGHQDSGASQALPALEPSTESQACLDARVNRVSLECWDSPECQEPLEDLAALEGRGSPELQEEREDQDRMQPRDLKVTVVTQVFLVPQASLVPRPGFQARKESLDPADSPVSLAQEVTKDSPGYRDDQVGQDVRGRRSRAKAFQASLASLGNLDPQGSQDPKEPPESWDSPVPADQWVTMVDLVTLATLENLDDQGAKERGETPTAILETQGQRACRETLASQVDLEVKEPPETMATQEAQATLGRRAQQEILEDLDYLVPLASLV